MSEINEIREDSFAELLEGSLKTLNTGDIVTGVITSISSTEIHVDLSTKGTGILSAEEMPIDENGKPAFKVGDEIEAFVVRVSDVEGVVGISRKKIERMLKGEEHHTSIKTMIFNHKMKKREKARQKELERLNSNTAQHPVEETKK